MKQSAILLAVIILFASCKKEKSYNCECKTAAGVHVKTEEVKAGDHTSANVLCNMIEENTTECEIQD